MEYCVFGNTMGTHGDKADKGPMSKHAAFLYLILSLFFVSTVGIKTFAQNQTTTEEAQNSQLGWVIFFLVIFVSFIVAVWWKIKHRKAKYRERRYFPETVKRETLRKQNYKCAVCKRSTGI
jgi:hypothetical protein